VIDLILGEKIIEPDPPDLVGGITGEEAAGWNCSI
jgi:hypothetical protein